jgi:hypothetical protein
VFACTALLLSACGEEPAQPAPTATTEDASFGALPFGIRTPAGSQLLAVPLVAEQVMYFYAGQPVHGTRVQAALRVTAEDPLSVFDAWIHELGRLGLGPLDLSQGHDAPPGAEYGICRHDHPASLWCEASFGLSGTGAQPKDRATVQLWATDREPIVLVDLARFEGGRQAGEVIGEFARTEAPKQRVKWRDRGPGDRLFEEQGAEIDLPRGTRSRVPMLPVDGGTGGSFSILTTADPASTLEDLRRQAIASTEGGGYESEPVKASKTGDAEIWDVGFVIPAGGWMFSATAIRPAGSEEATVYVGSGAD